MCNLLYLFGFMCAIFPFLIFYFWLCPFIFYSKKTLSFSSNTDLMPINSITFCLSKKLHIFSSVLNDNLPRQFITLGCMFLSLSILKLSCYSLLACKVAGEKSAGSFVMFPLYVTYFSLASFKIVSPFLTFVNLNTVCFGVGIFEFFVFGILCLLDLGHLFPFPD